MNSHSAASAAHSATVLHSTAEQATTAAWPADARTEATAASAGPLRQARGREIAEPEWMAAERSAGGAPDVPDQFNMSLEDWRDALAADVCPPTAPRPCRAPTSSLVASFAAHPAGEGVEAAADGGVPTALAAILTRAPPESSSLQ